MNVKHFKETHQITMVNFFSWSLSDVLFSFFYIYCDIITFMIRLNTSYF